MTGLYVPYSRFGGKPIAVDMTRCRAQTYDSVSRNFSQCCRKVAITVDGIGYCRQHSPEAARARAEARQEKFDARMRALTRGSDRLGDYLTALREIAEGAETRPRRRVKHSKGGKHDHVHQPQQGARR